MIVILHGWSDSSKSFKNLGKFIHANELGPVADIYLGDYVSMDDEVTYDDIKHAMQQAWVDKALPTSPRSVDVVVHSTGGLVIRDWMTTFFQPDTNPIHRLLFLAPANFGSPLAHKGNAVMGRIIKGFTAKKIFQTGRHILHGLELASDYSWHLAERDLFGDHEWYGQGRVLGTVLVGNAGYNGISALANEDGSDGTVRVSTANLNAARMTWDFATDPGNPNHTLQSSRGAVAFCRLNDENHSTIAKKGHGFHNKEQTGALILASLQVDDDGFDTHRNELEAISSSQRAEARDLHDFDDRMFKGGYQNTVVRVSDDLGHDVTDYCIEFFAKNKKNNSKNNGNVDHLLTAKIQRKVIRSVHTYGVNPSYRSILINTDMLKSLLVDKGRDLYLSLTALPQLEKNGVVGYKTLQYHDIGSIHIASADILSMAMADRTLLIDIVIKRHHEGVFKFTPLAA